MSFTRLFPWLRAADSTRRWPMFPLVTLTLVLLAVAPVFGTVSSGEIVASSVSAQVGTTVDPVNGVSVTFRWRTVHPGNSIVIIENPSDYHVPNNTPTRQVVQNDNTTDHVVVVDHFPVYSTYK